VRHGKLGTVLHRRMYAQTQIETRIVPPCFQSRVHDGLICRMQANESGPPRRARISGLEHFSANQRRVQLRPRPASQSGKWHANGLRCGACPRMQPERVFSQDGRAVRAVHARMLPCRRQMRSPSWPNHSARKLFGRSSRSCATRRRLAMCASRPERSRPIYFNRDCPAC
jgi:hypothetical protein